MNKISLIAFAAAALSASSALAAAGGMYVGLSAGYQMVPGKVKADIFASPGGAAPATNPLTKTTHSADLKGTPKGANINGAFGYIISDEFRTALSFQYNFDQTNTYNTVAAGAAATTDTKSKLKISGSWDVAANFYYDFLNSSSFTPFVGVKLGYGSRTYQLTDITLVDANNSAIAGQLILAANKNEIIKQSKQTKKGFVFGGTVGVAYKINPNLSLELAYAVQTLPKAQTKVITATAGNTENAPQFKAKNLAHNINAGVRFAF